MMMNFRLHLCLGVLLGAALANSETGDTTERVGDTVQRFVKVPTESFNKPSIVGLCKKSLTEEMVPLSKLVLATTETDLLSMRVQKATHTSYQSWYSEFVDQRASVGPAAELITVAGRATLRIQDRPRSVSTIVLGSGDALRFVADGHVFNLLDFSGRNLAPVEKVAPEGEIFEFYFCSGSAFTRDSVKTLTKNIMRELGLTGVTVAVRSDTWFIEDSTFPIYYRFSPSGAPPTVEAYRSGRQVTCVAGTSSNIRCY
jgi:hypothetical protein